MTVLVRDIVKKAGKRRPSAYHALPQVGGRKPRINSGHAARPGVVVTVVSLACVTSVVPVPVSALVIFVWGMKVHRADAAVAVSARLPAGLQGLRKVGETASCGTVTAAFGTSH
jgi:hypothetical protein